MAFRQPQRPRASRQLSFSTPVPPAEAGPSITSPQRKRTLEESEEWILFSPTAPAPSQTASRTDSTERTPRTAGLSRFSDFGSLGTATRSDKLREEDEVEDLTCQGTSLDEAELDSLDDGLRAFHEPSEHSVPVQGLEDSGGTILPTHDGLGSFPDNSQLVQEQIWQFERHNPRRVHVRRKSEVQRRLEALQENEECNEENERMQRIEKWRLDQSRALLEEIERATRRQRRMSRASTARSRADSTLRELRSAAQPSPASVPAQQPTSDGALDEHESFWQRLARRVIRDLMGIDENLASVIFGEALVEDETVSPQQDAYGPLLPIPPESLSLTHYSGETWEQRLLHRLARELGILVHQLSEHPGAFSTYLRTQDTPLYPGLLNTSMTARIETTPTSTRTSIPNSTTAATSNQPSTPLFAPTLPALSHHAQPNAHSEASLWGIEEEPDEPDPDPDPLSTAFEAAHLQQEREYWERELDVKMVFGFLLNRFSSRPPSPSTPASGQAPSTLHARRVSGIGPATSFTSTARLAPSGPDLVSARRAALIRQHHPLVSRNVEAGSSAAAATRRKDSLLHRHHYHHSWQPVPAPPSPVLRSRYGHARAGSSSCASQSTKRSKKSGSSRNYWDIGGSVASGGAQPVMGVWGEA